MLSNACLRTLNHLAIALVATLLGCGQWQSADDDSANGDHMVITFVQNFGVSELCFDFDGDDIGWITGCGRDLELYLDVEDGVIQDGSEMSMSGSDTLVIDDIPYGPATEATAPLEGEFSPYGSPYGPCFAGRPHHPSDEVSIWLSVWGGFTQRELHLAVRLGGVVEGFGMLQSAGSLDPAFELDENSASVSSCRPAQGFMDALSDDEDEVEDDEDITPSP